MSCHVIFDEFSFPFKTYQLVKNFSENADSPLCLSFNSISPSSTSITISPTTSMTTSNQPNNSPIFNPQIYLTIQIATPIESQTPPPNSTIQTDQAIESHHAHDPPTIQFDRPIESQTTPSTSATKIDQVIELHQTHNTHVSSSIVTHPMNTRSKVGTHVPNRKYALTVNFVNEHVETLYFDHVIQHAE